MIRKIPQSPLESDKLGESQKDTMAKVQHFSGISKRIPFEGFDFYDLFRVTFENSELGRMKRLLPLHEMAVNFGLVSNHPVRKRGPRHSVFLRYFIRYSCAIFGVFASQDIWCPEWCVPGSWHTSKNRRKYCSAGEKT